MNYYSFVLILVALLGKSIAVLQENYLVKNNYFVAYIHFFSYLCPQIA